MKIVLKYILNNIKDRKLRTLVMLLSILLSTALLFVSMSVGDSYAGAQRKMSRGMTGSAALAISLKPGADGKTDWIRPEAIPELSSIRNAVGMLEAPAVYKKDGYYENFDIIAADMEALVKINKPRLIDGSEPGNLTGSQIILPQRFAAKFNVKQGDDFTLWINGQPYGFQVAAIAAYDTVFLRHTRGTNALVSAETLSAILGAGNGYSRYLIEPAEGIATALLQKELEAALPGKYNLMPVVNGEQIEADARQKSMPFFLIGFFSLTMSVFIIYSSYKVITLERLPVLGTFRSIGATERTVTNILLLESLVYGGMGALTGIPAGFAVLKWILYGLSSSLTQGIDIPMAVSPVNILAACLVAMATSVLSAWIPVRRAGRLPVKDVILGTAEEKKVSRFKLFIWGMVLFAFSAIIPYIAKASGDNFLLPAGGASLAGLLASTIIIIPMLISGASHALERLYGTVLCNEGRLAARNMRDNRNISQNITLLFISISAIITISVIGSFVQVYIGDVFKGAKLDGFADAIMSREFIREVRQLDGMDEVLPVQVLSSKVYGDGVMFGRVEGTEDIKLYGEMFAMHYEDEKDRNDIETDFAKGRNILISADAMKSRGIRPGNIIRLSAGGQEFEYRVRGSYKIRSTNTEAIIPSSFAMNDFKEQNYGIIAYTAANPDEVMVQIRDMFGSKSNWSRTVEEFNSDASGTVGAFLAPLKNLTWFILVLASVGIMNNLLINFLQKRRATAMYKSVGMSNFQNMIITLTEGFSSGLLGAAIGIMVAWLEINTIFLVAGPRISIQPRLDAGIFLSSGALGIGITLIGSAVPIIKRRKMKIVDHLKFD